MNRAEQLIPTGSQTFSKSYLQYPKGRSPLFLKRGKGARVWDIDSNEYYDLVSALLPVVLGHCDPDVNRAIKEQLNNGISFSLSTELEFDLASKLNKLIPCAEKIRFAKNGSDATAGAVRLSRAFTGKDKILALGYHGWQDWYVGATTRNKGVPESVRNLTDKLKFGDIDAIKTYLKLNHSVVAAVIMEPYPLENPPDGYLTEIRDLCTKYGIVLIFDEIITGFRLSLGGAQQYYNVIPDLACFGKSMGNGMPISAIVGRSDIMSEMDEIFFSGTFGGEALSLAASLTTINKLEKIGGIELLWKNGNDLFSGLSTLISNFDLAHLMNLQGCGPWFVINFSDDKTLHNSILKTRFLELCFENGILTNGTQNVTCSFTSDIVTKVLRKYKIVFEQFHNEYQRGQINTLVGDYLIEPVFKPRL